MRILFDQGTPVPLGRFLNSHTVTIVYEKGWSRTRNGDLLRLADQEMFEVFPTTDQNLKYQQNLTDEGLVSRDCKAIRETIETEPKIRKWFRDPATRNT